MPRVKRRGHIHSSGIDFLEALLAGSEGWTEQENAEIEAHLERRYPALSLVRWRQDRELFENLAKRVRDPRAVLNQ